MIFDFSHDADRPTLKRRLAISAGLGVLFAFSNPSAIAQDQDTGETETAQEDSRRLNTVEVTATRREGVTVQDVPIAVTAFDSELLQQSNFQNVNNLEQLSPSIQITQGQSASAGTIISIRGIGTGADNFGFEPAVGIFVDGVYRTRTGSGVQELPELAGVEVLRGPQGTLFGRNTSAGVVSIRTAKPTFEPTAFGSVQVGNFDQVEVTAGVSGGITDKLAGRFEGSYRRRDGFIEDVNNPDANLNNIDRFLLRGQLLYEGEDYSVRFIADYSETNEVCCGATIAAVGDLAALDLDGAGPAPAVNFFDLIAAEQGNIGILDPAVEDTTFVGAFSPQQDFTDEVQDFGFSLEYNHEFGIGNFTSITAYRDFDALRNQDIDYTGLDFAARDGTTNADEVWTQEFRLQGLAFGGKLDWLVGAFYLHEEIETFDTIQAGSQYDAAVDIQSANAFLGLGLPPQTFFNTIPGVPTFFFASPTGAPTPFLGLAADPGIQALAADLAAQSLIAGGANPLDPAFAGQVAAATPGFITPAIAGAGFTPLPFTATPDGAGAFDTFDQTTDAIAIFTHNEFSLTDQLTLTGGLRYNYEEKDIDGAITGLVPACLERAALAEGLLADPATAELLAPAFIGVSAIACNPAIDTTLNAPLNGTSADRSDSQFTGTVSLSYALNEDILFYTGFSRGFKSGGFNLARDSADGIFAPGGDGPQLSDLEFDEETVNSYEAGIKSTWLDGRLIVNATGFFTDVQDFQENVFNGTNFIVSNVDVETFGIELDTVAEPIDGLVLQGGFIWIDASRTENLPGTTDTEGRQLGNTPEFVITAQGTYTVPLTQRFEGVLHANVRWQDATELTFNSALDPFNNGSFATVGARAGIQTNDGNYSLSVFAENLFDQEFNLTAFSPPPAFTGTVAIFPGAPRFWGVEGRVRF
ncbi:MAG: TonB-dependent receptor [Pseudomonadota bacterium]